MNIKTVRVLSGFSETIDVPYNMDYLETTTLEELPTLVNRSSLYTDLPISTNIERSPIKSVVKHTLAVDSETGLTKLPEEVIEEVEYYAVTESGKEAFKSLYDTWYLEKLEPINRKLKLAEVDLDISEIKREVVGRSLKVFNQLPLHKKLWKILRGHKL